LKLTKSPIVHLSAIEIIQYLEQPESSTFRQIRGHIRNCTDCLQRTHDLAQIQHTLLDKSFSDNIVNAQTDNIYQFIKNNEPEPIDDCFSNDADTDIKQSIRTNSIYSKLSISHLMRTSHKTPIFLSISIVLITLISTMILIPHQKPLKISVYQDFPFMEYTRINKFPGIGFFTADNKNQVPYNPVNIQLQNEALLIAWDNIENVNFYDFKLISKKDTDHTVVANISTAKENISIKNIHLSPDTRYEYQISGNTNTGLKFSTAGGFITSIRN